jgi:hypothetical protein
MSWTDALTFHHDLPFIPLHDTYVPFTSSPQFTSLHLTSRANIDSKRTRLPSDTHKKLVTSVTDILHSYVCHVQWYLGTRPLWNKSKLVYVLFGRERFCLVYDHCLEYDSCARTCVSQNETWQAEAKFFRLIFSKSQTWWASTRSN